MHTLLFTVRATTSADVSIHAGQAPDLHNPLMHICSGETDKLFPLAVTISAPYTTTKKKKNSSQMTEEIQINRKHIQIFLMSACFELETAEQKSAESQASCSPLSSQGERGGLGEEGRKEPGLFPHL